jgi:hypothetical protein
MTGWHCTEETGGYLCSCFWVTGWHYTEEILGVYNEIEEIWGLSPLLILGDWWQYTKHILGLSPLLIMGDSWHYTEPIWGFSLLLILCDWLTIKLKRFGVYIHSLFWVTDAENIWGLCLLLSSSDWLTLCWLDLLLFLCWHWCWRLEFYLRTVWVVG